MHQEPDVGFNPGSPGSCPGPKTGAKPLRHPGIPPIKNLKGIRSSKASMWWIKEQMRDEERENSLSKGRGKYF